jgi:O-methyltransferase domain/Dimerisation domain
VSEQPIERQMWTLVRGAMVTKTLGLVADLGIADKLAQGPLSVAELAVETGADEDALYRFLRALATDGVFSEERPRVFANTALSELLITDRSNSWRDFAHLFGNVWYSAFDDAGASLQDGDAAFPARFGTDFWRWLEQHPDEGAAFNRAMASGADEGIGRLADLEWSDGETVVDVGGGNGATLVALLRLRATLKGVVFDLPETARDAERIVASSDLSDRCSVVAGSFFDAVPAGDVYTLSGILHDWDDEHASQILHTIRKSAPPHARIVIRDAVIPQGDEPHGSKWLDLLMLVLLRGRERTEEEWRRLLGDSDFEAVSIGDGLIEARCR